MAKAHEIAIAADAHAFDQGIRDGVIKPLDKAEQALEDLGDAAGDAGRDGARGLDKLEDALKDAQRQAKRTEDAVDDIGTGGHRGFGKASEAAGEFKQEALQNLSEVTSSFDGSMQSVTDLVQGTFGGIASSIPGIGLLGAAAALGVGAIGAAFAANDEAAKQSEERAAEWADAYVEAGGRILSASQIIEKARAIVTDPEQYKKAQSAAKDWGVDESTALLAMAGDTNALAEARSSLAARETEVSDALKATGGDVRGLDIDHRHLREEVNAGKDSLSQLSGEMDRGAQGAGVYSTSLRLLADHTEGATRSVDDFGDTVVTLPDGKQIYIDAETGEATDNVNAIEKRIYGVPEGHHTTMTVSADMSEAEAAIWELLNRDLTKTVDVVVNTFSNLGGVMR